MNVDRAAPSGRRGDLCFTILLSLMPVVFLANVLFTDQVLVGDNLARDYPWLAYADEELLQRPTNGRSDPLHEYYPHRVIAARIAEAGRLPLWNPYFLAGTPFLATESQAGLFYPLNLIYSLIDPLRGFGVTAYVHLVLAGVFMYAYLRSIGLKRLSGFIGATSFQFSGYFLINLMWLPRVCTAAWAPLLFFGLERYWREERWGYALLMAVGMAMSLLAGMMGVVVYVVFGLLLYLIFRAWQSWDEDGWRRTARKTMIVLVGLGLGVLLASVQLVPTYEAMPYFERAYLSYEETWDTGRPVSALATAVLPESLANYWRPNVYGGILSLVLAAWAVVFNRNKQVLFFAALAVLALCLFVNVPEFLFRVLYVIPVFRLVRLVEVKVVYAFCLSVLAGWGFSSVVGEFKLATRGRMRVMSLALIAVGLVALGSTGILVLMGAGIGSVDLPSFPGVNDLQGLLRLGLVLISGAVILLLRVQGRIGYRAAGFLTVGVVAVEMFHFGWKLNPPQRAGDLFFETEATRFLQADDDLFRIIRGPGGENVLPPNTPAVYGLMDSQGYSSLTLAYYGEFMELIEPGIANPRRIRALKSPSSLTSELLDFLNVKYVLVGPEVNEELEAFDRDHQDVELLYDGEIKIYENKDVLPRAYAVTSYTVAEDRSEVLKLLRDEGFDPATQVILEEQPLIDSTGTAMTGGESQVDVVEYGPSRVIMEASLHHEALVVLSEVYYPGWKALVDGVEREIYRANYAFRAVRVESGSHHVELVYDPTSFKIGLGLSACALAVIIGSSLWLLAKRVRVQAPGRIAAAKRQG